MPTDDPETEIRAACAADAADIAELYLACLVSGVGSLEDAPDRDAMLRRIHGVLDGGAPFLVAWQGNVVGFAHVAPYRPGAGFGHCVSSEIWIAPAQRGQGLGWALLRDLVIACREAGLRQMLAHVRADSEAALALYASVGFSVLCLHREACRAGGRLHDVVVLRRALDRIAPAAAAAMVRRHAGVSA